MLPSNCLFGQNLEVKLLSKVLCKIFWQTLQKFHQASQKSVKMQKIYTSEGGNHSWFDSVDLTDWISAWICSQILFLANT